MLAIGRALVGAPKVLLLDEPLEGLAPIVVEALFDALARIRDDSPADHRSWSSRRWSLRSRFAETSSILDRGRIVHRGKSRQLADNEALQAELLGVAQDGASG